jgi:xylanolytic transcriptional activator XlnR
MRLTKYRSSSAILIRGFRDLTSYTQRNFRKVMRSALAQVKGRVSEDFGEQQLRRREVLSLYRWTGDGTGLAL